MKYTIVGSGIRKQDFYFRQIFNAKMIIVHGPLFKGISRGWLFFGLLYLFWAQSSVKIIKAVPRRCLPAEAGDPAV